jgi:hypothetical protein
VCVCAVVARWQGPAGMMPSWGGDVVAWTMA